MSSSTLTLVAPAAAFAALIYPFRATGDVIVQNNFWPPDTLPSPDPLFKKLGDYVFYASPQTVGSWDAKATTFALGAGSPKDPVSITEIRLAQPATPAGTLSLWTVKVLPNLQIVPDQLLGSSSQVSTFLSSLDGAIGSWDFSSTSVVLNPSTAYAFVVESPASFYVGVSDVTSGLDPITKQWTTIQSPGPAFEIRGVPIPAPGTGVVMFGVVAGLGCKRRKR